MLSYTYDEQNQLTTVKNGSGTTLYSYSYDTMGNIRSKTDGSVTHLYTYGNPQWADLLTAYDGHIITYDGSGNPLSYYNGADYTFTWEQGRQLASVTKGNKTASYTYDMSGVRSSKTVNGVSYEYTTLSGKITRMTWSGNAVDIVYDDAGRPYLLRYTPSGGATQTYYYVLNLQGDVVGLMNTSMQMVVKYSYDPWGKLTGTTATSAYVALAQANPLRYRSYCYDIETGFYYLQTRYYDPTIARFINADGYLFTGATGLLSYNMFAYCENNQVTCSDPNGKSANIFSNFCVNMTDGGGSASVHYVDITDRLNAEMIRNAEELSQIATVYGGFVAAMYFKEKVQSGGDWDLKVQESWNLKPDVTYVYNGKLLRYDDIGNIHYGFVGRVLFQENTLLIGGGYAQIVAGTAKIEYIATWFDDPHDSEMISFGYHLWDKR